MDSKQFTGKQLFIIIGTGVLINLIGGLILYHITKPKTTDPATPPVAAKQGTTPAVTTTPVTTTPSEG